MAAGSATSNQIRVVDGSLNWVAGVDSSKVTTLAGEQDPTSLKHSNLYWSVNATVRGGGIYQRTGWQPRVQNGPWSGLWQGCWLYEPSGGATANTVTLKNLTFPTTGTTISATPSYSGPLGTGANAFQSFVSPAVGGSVQVVLGEPYAGNVGDVIALAGGNWQVTSITILNPASGYPYFIAQVGGRIYKIEVVPTYVVTDLSAAFGLTNPPDVEQAFFCQGEIFLVIQAGDYTTLPLFWDGTTLRRSLGISPPTVSPGTVTLKNVNDTVNVGVTIPAAQSVQITSGGSVLLDVRGNDAFVVPAVGASVTFNVKSVIAVVPTSGVYYFLSGGLSKAGEFQLTAYTNPVQTAGANFEIPAAGPMDYYMGRLWYAFGRSFTAGDIVFGPSGTAAYGRLDSILKVTENQVAANGDGFRLPSNAGNIRAVFHTQELNATLGEGKLYISTRKVVYRLNVPVTRDDWTAAGDGTGGTQNPFITVALLNYGAVSDRCVVQSQGDVFFQTLEPAIRSLELSVRNFGSWGNVAISSNERRVLDLNDRALLHAATGIQCFNRLYQSALPFQTPVGIAHKAIAVLDFDLITTLDKKLPPAWEGVHECLWWLQLSEGDFGGRQRMFGWVVSQTNGTIELWETTEGDKRDDGDKRIQQMIETPSYTWSNCFALKKLETLELWFDRLYGTVEIEVFYRPDQASCWIPYAAFKECAARDCTEDLESSAGCSGTYPNQPYCEQFRATKVLPAPASICLQQSHRPSNIFYQVQFKILSRGSWRLRGLLAHAIPVAKAPFEGMIGC